MAPNIPPPAASHGRELQRRLSHPPVAVFLIPHMYDGGGVCVPEMLFLMSVGVFTMQELWGCCLVVGVYSALGNNMDAEGPYAVQRCSVVWTTSAHGLAMFAVAGHVAGRGQGVVCSCQFDTGF